MLSELFNRIPDPEKICHFISNIFGPRKISIEDAELELFHKIERQERICRRNGQSPEDFVSLQLNKQMQSALQNMMERHQTTIELPACTSLYDGLKGRAVGFGPAAYH